MLSDELIDIRSMTCEQYPLESFNINTEARYLKITMDSYHDTGTGLQHVNVNALGYKQGKMFFTIIFPETCIL